MAKSCINKAMGASLQQNISSGNHLDALCAKPDPEDRGHMPFLCDRATEVWSALGLGEMVASIATFAPFWHGCVGGASVLR